MDGILVVDKPAGMTSADVVRVAKRQLRVKVGHVGTLDPFATGVLPLCLGEGTKIAQYFLAAAKGYEGTIRLGRATDTGDRTGATERETPIPPMSDEALAAAATAHLGPRLQTPPMYSAIKQSGIPLYRLARQGREVERVARPIEIYQLRLWRADPGLLGFEVRCSKGTYVRVLAEDIGARLGAAAHLESLRRTMVGRFTVADAVALDAIDDRTPIMGLREALAHLPEFLVDAESLRRLRYGQLGVLGHLPAALAGQVAKLIGPSGELAAIVSGDETNHWRFDRVFAAPRAD